MLRRGPREQAAPEPSARPTAGVPAAPVHAAVEIDAGADQVMLWFLDAERWIRFQGRQAWIEPHVHGRLRVEMSPSVYVGGTFLEVRDRQVRFSWGREGDLAMPAGSTTVTITVEPTGDAACRVELVHEGLADRALADEHEGGWRYHLVRLAVAVSGATADAERIDLFMAATAEPNAIARRGLLERTCSQEVHVADGNDDTYGITPLATKLGRLVSEVPTVHLVRTSDVERVGAIIRCAYALRREPDLELEHGQLVASIDRSRHLAEISLFA